MDYLDKLTQMTDEELSSEVRRMTDRDAPRNTGDSEMWRAECYRLCERVHRRQKRALELMIRAWVRS